MRNRRGSTLLESLLALFFFSLIIQASLEFFGTARRAFFKLDNALSAREGAQAGLERLRADLLLAGDGLARPIALDLLAGIEAAADGASFLSLEKTARLANDVRSGDASLTLADADDFSPGKLVCLADRNRGEILTVALVDGPVLRPDSRLLHDFTAAGTDVLLLRKVAYLLDPEKGLLKRRVNASPAQPLIEDVRSFSFTHDIASGLASISLVLRDNPNKTYSLAIFPRNLAIARRG